MISNTGILTAGHVLYSHAYGWPIEVRITSSGVNSNADTTIITNEENGKYVSSRGWVEEVDYDYDYAVIALDKAFNVGYFGTRYYPLGSSLRNKEYYRYGYPGDKKRGTLWLGSDTIYTVDTNTFTFTGYSHTGESGSPIVLRNSTDKIVGIVSRDITDGNGQYVRGMAVRMRKEIVDFIVEYGGATRE